MKYIVIFILNFIDYLTTVYLTNIYGVECEMNPLMREALSEPWFFALIKLILFPLLLYWMWKTKKDDAAYIALGMFLAIVMLNLTQVFMVMSI